MQKNKCVKKLQRMKESLENFLKFGNLLFEFSLASSETEFHPLVL